MRTFRLRTPLVGATVAALGLALIAFDLWRSYDRDIREAERATRNLTVALEAHTHRTIQAVELALGALASRPETLIAVTRRGESQIEARVLEALIQAQVAGLPQVAWVSAFDRSGRPVASTDRATVLQLPTIADREYFKTLQSQDRKDYTYISAPFKGRASGRWVFVMSRRLNGPDGGFTGIMAAAIEPRFFPLLYRNIDIRAHGNVTLFHQDGTIVARSPAHEEFAGRSAAAGALFREHLPKADSGTARLKTVLQGREILYSYSRVTGTPLVINVAFEMGDVLAAWWQSLAVYAVVALGMVLLVGYVVAQVLRNRRRIEAAREQSEATLRALFDNASEGMLLADAHTGQFHSSNPAIRGMLGYTESEIARLTPADIHPPEQRAFVKEHFAALGRGEMDTASALPTLRKDGSVFFADISALQIRFGGRNYLASLFRDVTTVREAQEALHASEERLNEAQRIARVGSWDLDLVSGILTWSDEIFRLFEIDKTKFGATYEAFLDAIHPEDREAVNAAYTRSLQTREPYEITHRLLMADGRIKYVHERCESEFGARDKPVRSTGTVQDVTERKQAEEALRRLNDKLDATLQAIPDLLFELDEMGRYHEVWAYDPRLLAAQRESLLGHTVSEMLPPEAAAVVFDALREAAGAGISRGQNIRLTFPHGECWFELSTARKVSNPGEPLHFIMLSRDITARKRADEAILKLNSELEQRVAERTAELQAANRELETFTYSVAHDLKAPLRGINGYSRLLLDGYADRLDDQGRQFLHNVREATRQMDRLTNDLLAYSRLERREVHLGQMDPHSLVEALLAERAAGIQARGVAVSVAVPAAPVSADREGLTMALRNLLENALKFTRDTPNPAIEVGGRDGGDSCILWVRDNGVGFDMKYHDRIFAIFQRLHRAERYPGTGVGLAIVRKAMERMGGRAWAESEPGKGATFYLEIPK